MTPSEAQGQVEPDWIIDGSEDGNLDFRNEMSRLEKNRKKQPKLPSFKTDKGRKPLAHQFAKALPPTIYWKWISIHFYGQTSKTFSNGGI